MEDNDLSYPVPDLRSITACSFYWGTIDSDEAERLLEGKQGDTFLLRDSTQEKFALSVSFRQNKRSLHARIEWRNHKFSFESDDPGTYTSETVYDLLALYNDATSCISLGPMLTIPLLRNFVFPLRQLCHAVITTRTA